MDARKADGSKTVGKLGFMPIGGDTFIYEMTAKFLLLPGADGRPTFAPEELGEKAMCKLPIQFREMFKQGVQLNEDLGEQLALWASGTDPSAEINSLVTSYTLCSSMQEFDDLEKKRAELWKTMDAARQRKTKAASDDAKKRLSSQASSPPPPPPPEVKEEAKGDAYEGPDDPSTSEAGLFKNDGEIPH